MATVLGMLRRFERLDSEQMLLNTMKESADDIRDINLEQMYDGKTSEGVDITPSYLDDPYWDEHGGLPAAEAYSAWKDQITPNPRRHRHTPNLFINGYYHSSIRVTVNGAKITWNSTFDDMNDISEKFKNIYGLGGVYKDVFLRTYLAPVLREKMFKAVGLLMK